MKPIDEIQKICDGIDYSRDVPEEAKKIAEENNIVIIVGGSDDLMYCYGAECYLTHCGEHGYGWDGDTLQNITDEDLEEEACELGLMIWWCGRIKSHGLKIDGYSVEESGAFSYTVKKGIEFRNFKVYEEKEKYPDDIYCTGIIIQLPEDFKSYK